ncbi:hypothetical protein BCR34DRAFT_582390 [Clohesyomyces aquaticus]|uniref:Uncharacterized protein n=1 Tax=Clohesyomyces aquaticus TaxID=1231657 RepID=A0A1Y2AA80_9PLEO|nr:hypothetical protein BCR34DRAFT_582390 [Clohesyomyces aquaticus]
MAMAQTYTLVLRPERTDPSHTLATNTASSSFFCVGKDSPEIGSQDTVSVSPDLDLDIDLYTGPESPIVASPQFSKLATLKKTDTVSLLLPSAAFRTYDREVVFQDFTTRGRGEIEPRPQRAMLPPPSWEAGSRWAIPQTPYLRPGNPLGKALATLPLGANIYLRCMVLNIATGISCVGAGVQPREEALPQIDEATEGAYENGAVRSLRLVLEQDYPAEEEQRRSRKETRNLLARVFGLRWLRR